ncbi:MAG: aminotransferase class I/II-fold pyridoxal phosphate-dependent enzyme [Kiritimatiellia bacterium]
MYRMGQEEVDEVAKVIMSKQLFRVGDPKAGHQQEVVRFEQEWAAKIGTTHALLMCGGGTAALVCGLAGMGIGPGDEVIVPAYTWMATATAVLTVGAIPVLAEVDATMAIDPEDLERKIGPHTKAVIPVHMLGRPADMERIMAVARRRGIKVLEDSCQMVGGAYKGRRTGSWGDAGAFSFNFFKIISAGGEGGALVTSDRKLFETATIYADSGSAFRPNAGELSVPIFVAQQYRADEVMGAIARVQMQRMDGIIADLRRVRKAIEAAVAGMPGLPLAPCNDREGDCGVVCAFQFENEAAARAFQAVSPIRSYVGIDHGKHVYTAWEPLRAKRISHHPAMNPFNFAQNKDLRADYSDTACPATLALLRRTVFCALNPDWTEAQVAEKITALRAAAKR